MSVDALRQDVKGALLGLWKSPGFAVAALVARIVIGLMGALALTRLMQSLLYGVRPNDPITLVAVTAALLLIALLASLLPALRATRVSPVIALRAQ